MTKWNCSLFICCSLKHHHSNLLINFPLSFCLFVSAHVLQSGKKLGRKTRTTPSSPPPLPSPSLSPPLFCVFSCSFTAQSIKTSHLSALSPLSVLPSFIHSLWIMSSLSFLSVYLTGASLISMLTVGESSHLFHVLQLFNFLSSVSFIASCFKRKS